MPQRCKACTHPKRDAINKDLLNQTTSLAVLAERYGMTKSALDRHKLNHLKLSTSLAQDRANALTVVAMATDLYERADRIANQAERYLANVDTSDVTSRSVQAAAAALRELRGSIELLAKLVVTTADAPPENGNSWLDQALTEAVAALRPPELPGAALALETGVDDAEIVQLPE